MKKIFLTSFLFVLVLSSFSQTYLVSDADATTCSGNFYDTGGSAGAYTNNEAQTITFTPGTVGQMLQFTFTVFDSESLDHLRIYDGASTAAPLIIDLNGHAVTLPYTVTATNAAGQLTFDWTSDVSITYVGWAASISCVAPPTTYLMTNGGNVTTCSGFFLDPQGTSDYIDNNNTMTMTFCSGTAQALKFVFTDFETREAADNLRIYDGPNTSSTLIGTYSQTTSPGTIVSSSTCLTFSWTTDGAGAARLGWAATISCVAAPPANFTCANAAALPCGTTNLAGTTVGATDIVHGTGCTMSNYGVWYTFTGDGQQTTITSDADAGFDHEMAIASGSCGSLTNISCHDSGLGGGVETATFITTAGTQYYVYIAYWGTGATMGGFTISRTCIPTTPPANDNCTGAISMTVNADLNCGVVTAGNLSFATASGTPAVYPCGAGNPDDDVWFSFVATSAYHEIEILNVTPFTDMYFSVYSGNCGSLTNILCSDANSNSLTGLTIGNTYYVRVYSLGATASNSSFDICVGTPPPPANGSCATATSLPCGTSNLAGYTMGTTNVAHGTGCTMSNYGVWYTFTGTGAETTISSTAASGFNHEMAIASGACGSLTNISCHDAAGAGGTETTTFTTTAGLVYYVYIASNVVGTTVGEFTISRTCPSTTVVGSATCDDALAFCANNESTGVTFTITDDDVDYPVGQCSYMRNPSWWYMQISDAGDLDMTIASSCGDVDFACYGPFDNLTCDPADLTNLPNSDYFSGSTLAEYHSTYNPTSATTSNSTAVPFCTTGALASPSGNLVDFGGSTSLVEYLQIRNAQVGEYYIVLIGNFARCAGEITFDQTNLGLPGAGGSNCDIVSDCIISSISATTVKPKYYRLNIQNNVLFQVFRLQQLVLEQHLV